jgi:hypothetical protein
LILEQFFLPVPTDDVNEVSFWIRSTRSNRAGYIRIAYADGTFSTQSLPSSAVSEWQKVDLTASLTPGKMLEGLTLRDVYEPEIGVGQDFFDDFLVDVTPRRRSTLQWTSATTTRLRAPR